MSTIEGLRSLRNNMVKLACLLAIQFNTMQCNGTDCFFTLHYRISNSLPSTAFREYLPLINSTRHVFTGLEVQKSQKSGEGEFFSVPSSKSLSGITSSGRSVAINKFAYVTVSPPEIFFFFFFFFSVGIIPPVTIEIHFHSLTHRSSPPT